MDKYLFFDQNLAKADVLVLNNLAADIKDVQSGVVPNGKAANGNGVTNGSANGHANGSQELKQRHVASLSAEDIRDAEAIAIMTALNDPKSSTFEPSIFNNWDLSQLKFSAVWDRLLHAYIRLGYSIVRHKTDVIFLTHLLLYFTTSVPSALYLYHNFTWVHGVLHTVMQVLYTGTYTLMMHQHIHSRGILQKKFAWFDAAFPYLLDPLMGHTWNSYYYHHVKHHHVEGNGPNDLSSTIRYQRDSLLHFLCYVGKFYFFVGFELPLYFLRKGQYVSAAKIAFWEYSNYALVYFLFTVNARAAMFTVLLPLMIMRFGLMIGNWGQHALVDRDEPDSDYRSSITLIDVPSNRHCFNDGYHTSHHLNPLRHWRDHPIAFLKGKKTYASNGALVFHNIDYLMITFRLVRKDYMHLAKCLVPIGEEQIKMTLEERATMLKRHTQAFTEEDIKAKFKNA